MTGSITEEEGSNEEGEDTEHEGRGASREGKVGVESSMVMVVDSQESYGENAVGCRFLYSARVVFECFKFRSGSHESSSTENPFRRIRKERLDGSLR